MHLHLKTKITLIIAVLVLAVVGVNSWLYLATLTKQVIRQADNRADHVTRAAGRVFLGQHALQQKANQSRREQRDRDGKRERVRTHSPPRARFRQLAAPRHKRNRRGGSVPRIARRGRNGANHAETLGCRA